MLNYLWKHKAVILFFVVILGIVLMTADISVLKNGKDFHNWQLAFDKTFKLFPIFKNGEPILILRGILVSIAVFWLSRKIITFGTTHIRILSTLRPTNRSLIVNILQVLVYFVAATIALDMFGVKLTSLTFLTSAFFLGIGFGLQKIILNFISGLIILFERAIEVDDLIELDDGVQGYIRNIGSLYTLVETFDGREIMIPNGDLINAKLVNWTRSDHMARIDIELIAAHDADMKLIEAIMTSAAEKHPFCSKKKAVNFYFVEFVEYGLKVTVSFWIDDVTQGRKWIKSDVIKNIVSSFAESGIYPHTDVAVFATKPKKQDNM